MKHLRKFNQINEGKLNEVYGKQKTYGPGGYSQGIDFDRAQFDERLKEIYAAVNSVLEESPITFDAEVGKDNFTFTGPFGISMRISLGDEQDEYIAYIDKTKVKANDGKELWEKLKKAYVFKQFVKGAKIEKLREGRLKNILKQGKDMSFDTRNDLILDYLYFSEPATITNRSDNSGPWATTGTSVRTYKYDLKPLIKAWGEEAKMKDTKFEDKNAQSIYDFMVKKTSDPKSGEGWWQGKLNPVTKSALEANPIVDVEEVESGVYDVYTFTERMVWDNKFDDMRNEIIEKLGFKSRYLVDEKVELFEVQENSKGEVSLVIKVKTTVWYN